MKKIFFLILLLMGCASSFCIEYAVVVNKNNKMDSVLFKYIRKFYLLRPGFTHWPDNNMEVVPFIINPGRDENLKKIRKLFLKRILKFSEKRFDNYWIKRKSKGFSKKVVAFDSFDHILKHVKETEGGLGFLPVSLVKDVKVIEKFAGK